MPSASSVGRSDTLGSFAGRRDRETQTAGTEDLTFIGELTDADEPWTSVNDSTSRKKWGRGVKQTFASNWIRAQMSQ